MGKDNTLLAMNVNEYVLLRTKETEEEVNDGGLIVKRQKIHGEAVS